MSLEILSDLISKNGLDDHRLEITVLVNELIAAYLVSPNHFTSVSKISEDLDEIIAEKEVTVLDLTIKPMVFSPIGDGQIYNYIISLNPEGQVAIFLRQH